MKSEKLFTNVSVTRYTFTIKLKAAAERSDITVGKCDVDEAEELAERFGIMSIPTLMIFKGGEAVKTFIGVTDKQSIIDELN